MKTGKIIILDGAPSSGKTTIAQEIQRNKNTPYLYAGIDAFVKMFPQSWIALNSRFLKSDGLEFVFSKDQNGKPLIQFGTGPQGEQLIFGYINAIKGLADAGNNVIADGVITKKEWLEYMQSSLRDYKKCFVGLYAPVEVLEKREEARFEPAGMARGRFEEVYSLKKEYDLFIDTSKTPPEEAAGQIISFLEKK